MISVPFPHRKIQLLLALCAALWSSGCGSNGSVAMSGATVPVQIAFTLPGRSVAQLSPGTVQQLFDLLITQANAAVAMPGSKFITVAISGSGFATITDRFPATPGTNITRSYNVPEGPARQFKVQGYTADPAKGGILIYAGSFTIDLSLKNSTANQPITVNIPVNPVVNQPPAPTAPAIATPNNAQGSSQIAPHDPNLNNTHTYTITTIPSSAAGSASVNKTGLVTFTPKAGFIGTTSLVVKVTDQGGLSGSVTIPVTVTAPPVVAINTPSINALTGTPAGLVPSSIVIPATGTPAFTLTINGTNFATNASVEMDQNTLPGAPLIPLTGVTTKVVSSKQITLSFPAKFFPSGNLKAIHVRVRNSATLISNSATLTRLLKDTTAPTIVNTIPQNTATNVSVTAPIQVFFSELVDQTSVTPATFSLSKGTGAAATTVKGSISFLQTVNKQTIAIFSPATPLSLNTNYHLTIAAGIKDLGGNPMTTATTIAFTTATAIAGDPSLLGNLGFELANFNGYTVTGQSAVITKLTPTLPTELSHMAEIDTGGAAVAGKTSTLQSGLMNVPAGMKALVADLNFLSNEYPKYIGTKFDDTVNATLSTPNGTQTFFVTSVNVAPFVSSPTIYGGETGFFPWIFDLTGLQGKKIQIGFNISDVGDTAVTSALLIDHLRFVSQGLFISPSSGTVALGGTRQFSTKQVGAKLPVTWSINGIAGGNATVGTITTAGLYHAPNTFPTGKSVTVTATQSAGIKASTAIQLLDTTPPTITLLGKNPLTVAQGSTYQDAGATASDLVDGNLTAKITTSNPVNTAVLGTYTVHYQVSDAAGNMATATRTVHVTDQTAPTITQNTPANGGKLVRINTQIQVQFSESMKSSSITAGLLTLTNTATGTAVTTQFSLHTITVAGRSVSQGVWIPTTNLQPNTTYKVTLSTTTMSDLAGNLMVTPSPRVWSFTTGNTTIALPGVTPVGTGAAGVIGSYDGITWNWSNLANGANTVERWTNNLATPTTTTSYIKKWSDGIAATTSTARSDATVTGANNIFQFTANVAPSVVSLATRSLDTQLLAGLRFSTNTASAHQLLGVKAAVPNHTAAAVAGSYTIVQITRKPGANQTIFSTQNGTITLTAPIAPATSGTYTYNGTATDLVNPTAGTVSAGVAVSDHGTYTINAAGTVTITSAVNPSYIIAATVSANNNYIVGASMAPNTRTTAFWVGVKQHTNTINVANATYSEIVIQPSSLAPATGLRGEIDEVKTDANGWLNIFKTTASDNAGTGALAQNGGICGLAAPSPQCQITVPAAMQLTGSASGVIQVRNAAGNTLPPGIAAANGDLILLEIPGRAIEMLVKQ